MVSGVLLTYAIPLAGKDGLACEALAARDGARLPDLYLPTFAGVHHHLTVPIHAHTHTQVYVDRYVRTHMHARSEFVRGYVYMATDDGNQSKASSARHRGWGNITATAVG